MKRATLVVSLLLAGSALALDSLNCRQLSSWPGACFAVALDPTRNLAFMGSDSSVYVLDVSNPASPQLLSDSIRTLGAVNGLAYLSNRVYAAVGLHGLDIWDVSIPTDPAFLGRLDTSYDARGIAVAGNYAYVAADYSGLRIIDVSNPQSPVEVGYYDSPNRAQRVAVVGSLAYLADGYSGLRIVGVSNPPSPVEVGYYDTPGFAWGVAVAGSFAYVADDLCGLRVINVASPESLHEVGYCGTRKAECAAVADSLVYVADEVAGLRVITVSTPQSPSEVGYYDTPASSRDVALAGNLAYTADGTSLRIIEFYAAGIEDGRKLPDARPGPGTTIVRGTLVLGAEDRGQNTGHRAELLGITGQKALDLHAGSNDVSRLSPGVYFVREASGVKREASSVHKVVITR